MEEEIKQKGTIQVILIYALAGIIIAGVVSAIFLLPKDEIKNEPLAQVSQTLVENTGNENVDIQEINQPECPVCPVVECPEFAGEPTIITKEIIREVPVEKIVEKIVEVPKEVIKEVMVEKIIEVPVEKIVYVDREVPVEKIVYKEVPADCPSCERPTCPECPPCDEEEVIESNVIQVGTHQYKAVGEDFIFLDMVLDLKPINCDTSNPTHTCSTEYPHFTYMIDYGTSEGFYNFNNHPTNQCSNLLENYSDYYYYPQECYDNPDYYYLTSEQKGIPRASTKEIPINSTISFGDYNKNWWEIIKIRFQGKTTEKIITIP